MLCRQEASKQTEVLRKEGDEIRDGRCAHRDLGISASAKGPTPPAVATNRGYWPSIVHTLRHQAQRSGAG